MKIKFRKDVTTPSVRIANGEYCRLFNHCEQPFEVTDEEWAILEAKDFFEPVAETSQTETTGEKTTPAHETTTTRRKPKGATSTETEKE